ncbi:hypothetical protein OsJ_31166 [Oryza sativa Japonica Group]|uniref:Uncharacterized protein n=1 Tax=Oryza sativa subsp. japonica TaxID=39947 RepID=B9G863_ORYSJ|nr:hypothetical protein OsJ_31166 [Oryza sativa Japonica Group]
MAAELVTTAVPWMCGVARGEARRARKCRGDGEGQTRPWLAEGWHVAAGDGGGGRRMHRLHGNVSSEEGDDADDDGAGTATYDRERLMRSSWQRLCRWQSSEVVAIGVVWRFVCKRLRFLQLKTESFWTGNSDG